jgi:hypothetical protein
MKSYIEFRNENVKPKKENVLNVPKERFIEIAKEMAIKHKDILKRLEDA